MTNEAKGWTPGPWVYDLYTQSDGSDSEDHDRRALRRVRYRVGDARPGRELSRRSACVHGE